MQFILALLLLVPFSSAYAQDGVNRAAKSDQLVMSVHNDALYSASTFQNVTKVAPLLMADATTSTTTNTDTPTQPSSVTTTVKGGTIASQVLEWFQVAMIPVIGSVLVALFLKGMQFLGIQITAQQSDQLSKIAVNGLNDAMARAEASVRNNPNLSFEVKNGLVADAIAYTQDHAKETLTAMGLDPQSGKAVEAIRAKIATAINDPTKPTPPGMTPKSAGGTA